MEIVNGEVMRDNGWSIADKIGKLYREDSCEASVERAVASIIERYRQEVENSVRSDMRKRIVDLEKQLAFNRDWYGERWANLRKLFDGTPLEKPACDIMANGIPGTAKGAT